MDKEADACRTRRQFRCWASRRRRVPASASRVVVLVDIIARLRTSIIACISLFLCFAFVFPVAMCQDRPNLSKDGNDSIYNFTDSTYPGLVATDATRASTLDLETETPNATSRSLLENQHLLKTGSVLQRTARSHGDEEEKDAGNFLEEEEEKETKTPQGKHGKESDGDGINDQSLQLRALSTSFLKQSINSTHKSPQPHIEFQESSGFISDPLSTSGNLTSLTKKKDEDGEEGGEEEGFLTAAEVNDTTAAVAPSLPKLYIGGLFELSRPNSEHAKDGNSSELAAALLAIKHINQQGIIPGYQLELVYNDTKCNPGAGADAFFDFVYRKPQLLMLIATECSDVAKILGEIVYRWNLILVSYAATSPALNVRETYPSFFRMTAADSSRNTARTTFIKHFNWNTVATIHEDITEYSLAINEVIKQFERDNITLKATESFFAASVDDLRSKMDHLKELDARIIIGSFPEATARLVFCEAFRQKLYGARYVWMLVGLYSPKWWMKGETGDCTHAQLAEVAEGYFSVDSLHQSLSDAKSDSGLSHAEFIKELNMKVPTSPYTELTYDSVWAVALTLKNTMNFLGSNALENFDYTVSGEATYRQFMRHMEDMEFMGVSGEVFFEKHDRQGISVLEQNQGGTTVRIALVHPGNHSIDFECSQCQPIYWPGGKIPADKYTKRARIEHVDPLVLIVVWSISAYGLVLAGVFLAFNLYYRALKYIKLSSPKLNNVAVNGCMLVYISVVLFGLDDATIEDKYFPVVCSVRAFLLSAGFSLAFGAMFAKTFRVHQILTKAQSGLIKSKLLKDKQLLFLISALLLVDCLIISLWVIIDPMDRHVTSFDIEPSGEDPNVLYIPQLARCHSAHLNKWLGVFYAYKGLLLVFGVYMAWETRHVKIPVLNDSQYIGMNIYNVVLTSVTAVVLSYLLTDKPTLSYTVVSTLILLSTTGLLCLLFLPKIYAIFKHRGTPVVTTSGLKVEANTRRFEVDSKKELYYRTEVQNRVYKREIVELDQEISRMERLLELSAQDLGHVTDDLMYLLPERRGRSTPLAVRRRRAEMARPSSITDANDVATELPEISITALANTLAGGGDSSSDEKCPLAKKDSGFHTMSFKNHNFETLEQEEQRQQLSCASNLAAAMIPTDPAYRRASTGTSLPESETRLPGHVRRQGQEDGNWEERKSLLMDEFDSFSSSTPVRSRPRSDVVTLYFNNDLEDASGGSDVTDAVGSCDNGGGGTSRYALGAGAYGSEHKSKSKVSPACQLHKAATISGAKTKTKKSPKKKQEVRSRSCSNLSLELTDITSSRSQPDFSEDKIKRTRILQRELSRLKRELQDLGDLEMEVTFV